MKAEWRVARARRRISRLINSVGVIKSRFFNFVAEPGLGPRDKARQVYPPASNLQSSALSFRTTARFAAPALFLRGLRPGGPSLFSVRIPSHTRVRLEGRVFFPLRHENMEGR